MKDQPREYDDDDGRVICSMDVDGMRWHGKRALHDLAPASTGRTSAQMTAAQARKYSWYSLLAGLVIVAVFSVTWILFTLFCTLVWFR